MAKKKKAHARHHVRISVDRHGNFTYAPSFLNVEPGDRVRFSSPSPNFAIVFKGASPGDKLALSDGDPNLEIGEDAALGIYSYGAAVFTGSQLFLDPSSGDIGVGRGD